MYYPQPGQPYVPPPYPPPNMGMSGFVPPPAPNMVPQGMYPVTMGGQPRPPMAMGGQQPRPGPYPPQQGQPYPPQQGQPYPPQQGQQPRPASYPSQVPPMASSQPSGAPKGTPNIDSIPLNQIDTLPDAEVEKMLADEEELTKFVKSLPLIQDYLLRAGEVERLQAEVDALTKRSGANPELDAKRQEVEKKRAELQQKSDLKRRKEGELNPSALFEKLDAAAKALDNECEDIASQFLAGDMSAQDFAKTYKQKRVLFHSRSAKKEALSHSM